MQRNKSIRTDIGKDELRFSLDQVLLVRFDKMCLLPSHLLRLARSPSLTHTSFNILDDLPMRQNLLQAPYVELEQLFDLSIHHTSLHA